jgi:translation initiation factor 6 (eIF-6)
VFFSGGVMRAREVQQPCQLRFVDVLEHALANQCVSVRVNKRVKIVGMVRANSTGALIAKA